MPLKGILFYILTCCVQHSFAQLVLDRQVIGAFGMDYSGSFLLSSTAGEVCIDLAQSSHGKLTQGFHQPRDMSTILLSIEVQGSDCSDRYDVRIMDIIGCDDLDGITILWNNIAGGMMQNSLPVNTVINITTASGCSYTTALNLADHPSTVIASCELEFFNYFSPNSDGENDVWTIRNVDRMDVSTSEVLIYNRWGAMVWQGKQYDNTNVVWNGTSSNGSEVPEGTYYYLATINGKTYNGYIELMR